MSEAMMKFFETLGTHTSSLTRIMEGTQKINGQKLYDLAKEFEVVTFFSLSFSYTLVSVQHLPFKVT